jgi:DNA-binding transcriptional LysR family regulator
VNRARPEHHKISGLEVKTSNLCSEITLPTGIDQHGQERTAVCCLSSLNCETWFEWKDHPRFIPDVMRFLDNVLQNFIDTAPDWNMWLRAAGVEGIDTSRGPHFDVAVMAISAAVLGRGVALTTRSLVADDLASGRLVAPFDLELTFDTRVFFVCLPESMERAPVAAFRDWIVRMAEETRVLPAGASGE